MHSALHGRFTRQIHKAEKHMYSDGNYSFSHVDGNYSFSQVELESVR